MKKPRSSDKAAITAREQAFRSGVTNKSTQKPNPAISAERPLIDLLAISTEFFVFSYSPTLRSLITWSDNAKSVLGVDDNRIARDGNLFLRYIHVDDRFQILGDLEGALEGKIPFRATYRWIRPDRNEMRWLHCRAALKNSSADAVFEGIILDISDELSGPLRYFSAADPIHNVLSVLPGLVVILDKDLRISRLSQPEEFRDFSFGDFAFDKEKFIVGQPFSACFSDDKLVSQIQSIADLIIRGQRKNGNFRILENSRSYEVDFFAQNNSANSDGIVCVVSDISKLVHLESRVADLQRTESLRLLSAGIGHHFNNTLQTVIGQASVIQNHYGNQDLVNSACDAIVSSSLKAAELTRQLFSTIEQHSENSAAIDANLALSDAINKIKDLLDSGIRISLVLGQLPLVKADYAGLRSVFEAVLKNARDAIKNKLAENRYLSIKSYAVNIGEFELPPLAAGLYSVVSMSDSGTGMDPQTLGHCLDPFFTTKDPDPLCGLNIGGAGLGLSKAYSFLRSIGGTMTIDSEEPFGSSVQMYIPAVSNQIALDLVPAASHKIRSIDSIPPRVLLIDDDQIVSLTVQSMIQGLGYECVIADNFATALAQLKRYSDSLEMVLLDIILSTSDSSVILKRLQQIKPSLKIIGFSGAAPQKTQSLLTAGALEILEKPVQIQTLMKLLERYLGSDLHKIAV